MSTSWLDVGTMNEVVGFWPGADEVDLDHLAMLLASAQAQCAAFAPETGADVPVNYRQAQVLQARALYRSGMAGTNDQIGIDGQAVTVFPMDWTVKLLLRPRGIPRVG